MAITTTTLSKAVASGDLILNVTSATGFVAGLYVQLDGIEWCQIGKGYVSGTAIQVQRGQFGTINGPHISGGNVSVFALLTDFPASGPGPVNPYSSGGLTVFTPLPGKNRSVTNLTASGAIQLPNAGQDLVVILVGTSVIAATLAVPTSDLDGTLLYVVANGKAAHTLTVAGGIGAGGASFDVGTYSASQQMGCTLLAANGAWVLVGNGITSATAAAGGPIWS